MSQNMSLAEKFLLTAENDSELKMDQVGQQQLTLMYFPCSELPSWTQCMLQLCCHWSVELLSRRDSIDLHSLALCPWGTGKDQQQWPWQTQSRSHWVREHLEEYAFWSHAPPTAVIEHTLPGIWKLSQPQYVHLSAVLYNRIMIIINICELLLLYFQSSWWHLLLLTWYVWSEQM